MKKLIFLLCAIFAFSVASAQTDTISRKNHDKSKSTTVKKDRTMKMDKDKKMNGKKMKARNSNTQAMPAAGSKDKNNNTKDPTYNNTEVHNPRQYNEQNNTGSSSGSSGGSSTNTTTKP